MNFIYVFLHVFALSGRGVNDPSQNRACEDCTDKGHLWRKFPGTYEELVYLKHDRPGQTLIDFI